MSNDAIQMVIFGASGDLSREKIFPALFRLEKKGKLGANVRIIGASRRPWSDDDFRKEVRQMLDERIPKELEGADETWNNLAGKLQFSTLEFDNDAHYQHLKKRLEENGVSTKILYFSVSPEFYGPITDGIARNDALGEDIKKCRVAVEKPFGSDYKSAQALSDKLHEVFSDKQIYRIDHVISKMALIDIINIKRNNFVFKQLFNKDLIDHIQLTYYEDLTVGTRGSFYEQTGILRDMVQSHILEALSILMIDPDADFSAESFRNLRGEMIASYKMLDANDLVIGQYEGYRQEENVADDSEVETFVAMKLESEMPKWQGVPIYLRTGKALNNRYFDIHVVFRSEKTLEQNRGLNVMTFRIAPDSGFALKLWRVKDVVEGVKGGSDLVPINLTHCYHNAQIIDAYENLLDQLMQGDNALFPGQDEVFASWEFIDSIRKLYANVDLHTYEKGSRGPDAINKLIEKDNRTWLDETFSQFCATNE